MKTHRRNPWLVASLFVLATSVAHSQTLWFDGGAANIATDGDGASAGLAGTWNTTLVNWDQGPGLPHVVWNNSAAPGTIAAFGGPVGNGNRAVTVGAVNAVDLVFSVTGAVGSGTRWTLTGGTITLGDSVNRKASIDASAMESGASMTVGVNVITALSGDVSGGLTLTGTNSHMELGSYAAYFNGLNPQRRNLLSFSNLGINTFTGPVTIRNAVEIQGLDGSRYKALGPATNDITLDNGTLFLYNGNGVLAQKVAVVGTNNALSLNNGIASSSVSNSVTGTSDAVLWAVAGTNNGRLTFSGDLAGFAGTIKARSSASGAVVIDTNTFGGTFEVQPGSTLQLGNNSAKGVLGSNAVLNDGTILFNRSSDYTYPGVISGTGVVTKQSLGTLTLAGANTYTGMTTVSTGRLNLTGTLAGDINVTGGAISGTGSATGKLTMRAGTAIVLAGGAATNSLTVGGVEFFFPSSLDFAAAPVPGTVYDVLTYGDGGVEFPGDFASFVRGTLNHNTVAKKFTFTAGTPKSLTWNGGSGDWDQTVATNWNAGADAFYDWDQVTFNNPAAPAVVSLVGTLRPASIAVTNTASNDYTFSGIGSISGAAALTKSGDGTLVLGTANAYTGGSTINGGVLRLQNPNGAGLGAVTLGNSTLSLFRAAEPTIIPNVIVSAAGTSGLLTVDGSGADAGTGNNSTYNFGGIQVDGTLTVTRPTGGKGATTYNGVLGGSGTLIVGDNNGGVDLIVDATSNSRGRVLFNANNNTFNGHVQVLERGNFMNNTLNPSYETLTINAGGAISLLAATTESFTTVGRFNGTGIVARNTQSGQATLVVGGANQDDSFSGIIDATLFSGTGSIGLVKNGTATQTLIGAGIRPGGNSTVNEGTLKLEDTTGWASAIAFGATNSPVLEFAGSAPYTMSRPITGGSATASLVKSSTGTLTLGGANTFTGSVSVQAGTLRAANSQAFGANGTTITVANGAAIDTGGVISSRDYHAFIAGTGLDGTGVVLNSTATNINSGFRSLNLTADATIGGNGRFDVRPITAGQALVDLNGKTLTKIGTNLIGFVDGTITAGAVQLNEGTLALTRSFWTTGTLNVAAGAVLRFENNSTAAQYSYGMAMTLNEGTINTFGNDVVTEGSLAISGTSTLTITGVTHTQNGVVSGEGSLIKTGTGTFTLGSANHSYAGTTTVSGGSLLVDGTKSGAGSVMVQTTGTLGGSGTIQGATTIEAGGFVAPGGPAVGTLTLATATLAGTYQCQIDAATADRVNITGRLTISPGATLVISTLAAPTATEYVIATYQSIDGGPPEVAGVPNGYLVDDATPGVIKLVLAPAGFASWADGWADPALTDKSAGGDPDHDGVSNLLEYILGGDPRVSDTGILPKPNLQGDFLVLSYKRNDASLGDTSQTGQWSTNLETWNDIAASIVAENGDAPDDMEIRIPLSNALNGKLFGRLKAGVTAD